MNRFASCEWNVARYCEHIALGSLDKFRTDKSTAGQIGKDFKNLVRNMPRHRREKELTELADAFLVLVELRNDICIGTEARRVAVYGVPEGASDRTEWPRRLPARGEA